MHCFHFIDSVTALRKRLTCPKGGGGVHEHVGIGQLSFPLLETSLRKR